VFWLLAVEAQAELSNPYTIVESSRIDVARAAAPGFTVAKLDSMGTSTPTPTGTVDQVMAKAKETATKVKAWFDNTVAGFWGTPPDEKKTDTPVVVTPMPTGPTEAELRQREVDKITATMPSAAVDQTPRIQELSEVKNKLKTTGAVVSTPGRKGTSDLKLNTAGVPVFPMQVTKTVKGKDGKTRKVTEQVKRVPTLDIGEEARVSKSDFLLKDYQMPVVDVLEQPKLSTPALMSQSELKRALDQKIAKIEPAQDMDKSKFGIDKIVTRESLAKADYTITPDNPLRENPYRALTSGELKMLYALILLNKGRECPVLFGTLNGLSKTERFKSEANYHIGACAQKTGMYSVAFERLSALIRSENPDFAADSIVALSTNLPMEYEVAFSRLIRGLKNADLIRPKVRDEVYYLTAKGAMKDNEYALGRTYAEKVGIGTNRWAQAQYLIAVGWYAMGKIQKAVEKMEALRTWMATNNVNDKTLNSLTAINLARIYFNKEDYKRAHNLYLSVDKGHPLWVQALIEQAWAQLALDDFAGAIGNMYSLHSPYFKVVYKPESFVVRTIGYLNICQYGDAYKTLSWLEQEYRPWLDKVNVYSTKHKNANDYYETTISYLRGRSLADVDGLPPQILREMARQREFLNYQTSLNDKADEETRYAEVDSKIVRYKNNLRSRMDKANQRYKEAKANIAKAKENRALAPQVPQWRSQMKLERDFIVSFRYQIALLDQSRRYYKTFHKDVLARLEREKYELKQLAGKNLFATIKHMKSEMSRVLENNEFLRYEVFSGSGENIRYQVAGGGSAAANRIPASIKPSKSLNWAFEGEYWEDEIGSYRSSLKNNCPNIGQMEDFFKKEKSKQGGKAAALEKGVGR